MDKVTKKLDDIPQFYLTETNKGIHWRNQQHILLDQGRNSSKSRTIDEYNSIIVTRTTNVTKQSSKHEQYKQWNNENIYDPSPVCTHLWRWMIWPIQYNNYVIS